MLTFFDYAPSQNAWKVRQILKHLDLPHRTEWVSIFTGAGQTPTYLQVNPTGAVPAIVLDDGSALAESNAILFYLAQQHAHPDTPPLLPATPFEQAKVLQWLNYEADYVQNGIASLRYWTQTGRRALHPPAMIDAKIAASLRTLTLLDRELRNRDYLVGMQYSIADIALYAYLHRADEAEISLAPFSAVQDWLMRVSAQPGHLAEHFGYACDPHAFPIQAPLPT